MKFEFEVEFKVDTDSKKKSELLTKVKKKAIDIAGKALDCVVAGVVAVEDAVDKAGDALLDAAIAIDDKLTENNSVDDSEEDDEDSDEDDEDDHKSSKVECKNYTFWQYLDKICTYQPDSNKKVFDCVVEARKFLESIDFEATDYTRRAFEIAVTLEEITYDTVIEKLKSEFPDMNEKRRKQNLQDDFVVWMMCVQPEIQDYCKNYNFMLLLKYFVKKVRAS